MEPTTMFWIFVIFAFIGFITQLIWGVDIYKLYSDGGAILFMLMISFIVIKFSSDPSNSAKTVELIIRLFVGYLVPAVIGDAAGSSVAAIFRR